VRIPIPVVILLVLAVIAGVWWTNTREMDFLTPPTADRLEEIRQQTEGAFKRAEPSDHELPPPLPVLVKLADPPQLVEPPKPPVELGDLTSPPTLRSYVDLGPKGADHLIELAKALEEKGEFARALLAWERVMDRTPPNGLQAAVAIASIRRLRPTLPVWNEKPEAQIQITLQAGTGKKLSKSLTKALESVAAEMNRASSGIVKVKPVVTVGKTTSTKGPTPVALWLTGRDKKTRSTEVVSFTTASVDTLPDDLHKTLFQLIRNTIGKTPGATIPAPLSTGENPLNALNHRVTRLSWSELATGLNFPAKKVP
jgi:hypothetical protein